MGTWIEMHCSCARREQLNSRSLRGNVDRNHKYLGVKPATIVVPYVGTWIEIIFFQTGYSQLGVVPYVGTWIEIPKSEKKD